MTQSTWLPAGEGPHLGPQVIFGLDRNGICTLSVGSGLSALGFRAGELVGQDMFLLYRDDVLGTEAMKRALAGEAFHGEREYHGRRVAVYFEPVCDENGALSGALGVATDVTEQRTAEREAARARRRSHQLAELYARLTLEALDLPALLNVVVGALTETFADVGVLWMRASDGPELVPAASWHGSGPDCHSRLGDALTIEPAAYRCPITLAEALAAPQPFVGWPVPGDPGSPEAALTALATPRKLRSGLRVPLRSRGHVIGMVDIARTGTDVPFSAEEISLVADIAERCALAVDNAELLHGQQVAREDLVKFKALADASDNYIGISDIDGRVVYLNLRGAEVTTRRDGRDVWELVAESVGAETAQIIRGGTTAVGRWSGPLSTPNPDTRAGDTPETLTAHLDVFSLRHPESGLALGLAWVARDVTELRATEEALQLANAELSRFKALVDASPDFIAIADLEGHVQYVNPGGRAMVGMAATADVRDTTIADYLTPEGLTFSVEVEQPAVVLSGHWEGESTLRHHGDGSPIPVGIASFLMRDITTGEPFALATVQRDLTERMAAERALRDLVEQRAALLARLIDAQDAERTRIAADVHDDSVQALAAVDLRLGLLRRRLRERATDLVDELDGLQEAVSGATERLRALLFDLEPPDLDSGLTPALTRAAEEIFEGTSTAWTVDGQREPPVPEATRAVAYRIVKEALVNVLKHAAATHVIVGVGGAEEGLLVTVDDDGVGAGAAVNEANPGHRGVVGMRDRATLAGGRCTFGVSPYGGTQVIVRLPGTVPT